ncbi:MAG: hypothetical protein HOM48_03290 [Rhodobiaceae bacterium]|jgi:hypothetical protein|nr:hypothetical protein [Rhodobiaceae bacterium]
MFGIPDFKNYDVKLLRFMQLYTLLGAGGFGLVHLFYPSLFSLILGAPDNGAIMGDIYVASVFLSFALLALITFSEPAKYAPIAGFQGLYKALWCVFLIVQLTLGTASFSLHTIVYFVIMLSYAVGDYLVFSKAK